MAAPKVNNFFQLKYRIPLSLVTTEILLHVLFQTNQKLLLLMWIRVVLHINVTAVAIIVMVLGCYYVAAVSYTHLTLPTILRV